MPKDIKIRGNASFLLIQAKLLRKSRAHTNCNLPSRIEEKTYHLEKYVERVE